MDSRAPLASLRVRALGRFLARGALWGALAGLGLGGTDWVLHGRAPQAGAWLYAWGLGAGAGGILGCKLALTLGLIAQLRRGAQRIVWLLFAFALFAWCVLELGVPARLVGPYARLGMIALVGCAGFSAIAGALGYAVTPADPRLLGSWLGSRSKAVRALLLVSLAIAAAVFLWLDRAMLVGSYPFIHRLLERSSQLVLWVVATHAAPAASGTALQRWRVASRAVCAALLAALAACPLFTLGEAQGPLLGALRSAPLCELALAELVALADLDDDGYAPWLGGGDCAPFDPAINPGATEIPGNGSDDNCRLGDARAQPEVLPAVSWAPASAREPRSNVVLITIDTLRADHLGCYGYPRATSPHLDAWFARGVRYADAISAGAYTTVTMPALMRGVHARSLRWSVALQTNRMRLVRDARGARLAPGEQWTHAQLLSDDPRIPTLAERLRAQGYQTAAVVDDGGSNFLSPEIMARGFDRYLYVPALSRTLFDPEGDAKVAAHGIAALAALQAARATSGKPFFLWLHFYGVHGPDARHPDVPSFGETVVDRYDHEIASVDKRLEGLLAALDAAEQALPLLTVLTSDHGENIYPTGRAHGSNLAEDEIRVPLLMRGAAIAPEVVRETVSVLDVVPSALVRCGARALSGFDGVDALSATARKHRTRVLSDVWRYDARGHIEFDRVAAVQHDQRVVFEPTTNARRSFARSTGASLAEPDPRLEQMAFEYLEHSPPQPHLLSR